MDGGVSLYCVGLEVVPGLALFYHEHEGGVVLIENIFGFYLISQWQTNVGGHIVFFFCN